MNLITVIKQSKHFKIVVAVLLPFFSAILAGNILLVHFPIFLFAKFSLLYKVEKIFYYFLRDENLILLYAMVNSLFFWWLFYFIIMCIFKRGNWLDRFFEFSKPLIITVPFGIIYLVYALRGHLPTMFSMSSGGLVTAEMVSGALGKAIDFFALIFIFFTPLVLCETIWLGLIIKRTKGYGWFRSQCFAFGMFILLPLVITHLAKWLFVVIFLTKS